MFTLYTTPLSANGRKTLAVSRHLGLDPAIELVDVYRGEGRRPEYLAIHPRGKVPALVDGDLTLTESNAILQYVSDAYAGSRLWGRDAKRRADVSRWLFWESSEWQPALIPVLSAFVGRLVVPALASSPAVEVDWENARARELARDLDDHLRARRFLAGDEITLADFSVAGMMTYARPAGFPFEAFPRLDEWYARIEELEAWRATAAGPWS